MAVKKNQFGAARELYSWLEMLVFAVLFVIVILTFFMRTASVKGFSMIPTLNDKDQLILSNILYQPSYGDIVVIDAQKELGEAIVKRVIATEGQTVEVNSITGDITVDGNKLQEPYIAEPTRETGSQRYPLTVPKGTVFVMGDNRNHSEDSRFTEVGCIDTRQILGKVMLRLFPKPGALK